MTMQDSSTDIAKLYTKRAARYDLTEKIYLPFGFREERYRRDAIAALDLQVGDTVIDLGCGTGKNFAQLLEKIGPTGTLIGVDLTAAMLTQAQKKIDQQGWRNVQLINADIADFVFPQQVDAIISTFALSFSAEYATVIERSAAVLKPTGTLVIADMQWTDTLPPWLMRVGTRFASLFGVSTRSLKRNLAETIRIHFPITTITAYYFGTVFVGVGKAS